LSDTQTLPLLVYKEAFALNDMGMASAFAVVMMLIMLVFMIVYIRRTRSEEGLMPLVRQVRVQRLRLGHCAGGRVPVVLDAGHLGETGL
jgi:ABC-type Fe3+ transport system permease subunit